MELWFSRILEMMEKHIPIRRYRTIPHPVISEEITNLKLEFNNLSNTLGQYGWTPELRRRYTDIQTRLQTAYKEARNEQWNSLLTTIETDKRDPTKFWSGVKKLMGTDNNKTHYILDDHGNKLYETEDQVNLLTRHWRKIFRISEEENANFCQQTE